MTGNEDCASVLEQFMHDVANLPAEISHMMEEIQAKEKDMQQHLSSINAKDAAIQKQIKLSGSMVPHAKEKEFSESILKSYDVIQELQEQKIAMSDKASLLLERQLKKLDVRIRELQNDGQLPDVDGRPLPSVFTRKAAIPETKHNFPEIPMQSNLPLQIASANAMNVNMNTHRMNNQHHVAPHIAQPVPRQVSQIAAGPVRSSAPPTPAATLQHQQQRQREREHSAGAADLKRRKLNPSSSFSANIPAQPSSLRQSSLGPGTPKAGTPNGTSRAGSLPRSTTSQNVASAVAKKSLLGKKVAPHQQVSKLKGKPGPKGQGRLPFKKKGGRTDSPSHRSRGTTADSGDADSVLSSAEASDTESHTPRSRRGASTTKHAKKEESPDVEMGEGDEEEDQEDDRRYCFCNERSYGEMVACENEQCQYEWFHLQCLGLKKSPDDEELWWCPVCRELEKCKKEIRDKGLSAAKMPGQRKVWPNIDHTIHVK
jgi:inhibitor of growth protein 3